MCDIIFDLSAHNILACCQALVAAYDTNKQLIASLCSQIIIETLAFEIKRIKHCVLCYEGLYHKEKITWSI